MFTHPETVCVISALDYQERLREAAKERVAARAQTGGHASLTGLRTAPLVVASWLGGIVSRLRGTKQSPVSPPLSSI